MSNIIFPEGVTWTQRYITGGDFLTSGDSITKMGNLYRDAVNEVIIVGFDTPTNMTNAFYECNEVKNIFGLDTSNVTNMLNAFKQCWVLVEIPQLDTSNVTTMNGIFYECKAITSIPQLDTSNVTTMNEMFRGCESLQTVPLFDTSNVTNMSYMFYGCKKLTTIPAFDTSKVTSFSDMFNNATNIISIPLLDCSKVNYGSNINLFSSTTMTYLTDLGGFKDLGMVKGFNKPSYFLRNCPNLTKDSVLNVLNNLYDRKTAGYSVVTLPFHANALALLSDEEKAIATNKGWTLATS